MTTQREAMQMALDALELWEKSFPNWWVCSVDNKSHEAIEALRTALAAPTLVDGVDPARIKDFDVTAYGRDGDGFDRAP